MQIMSIIWEENWPHSISVTNTGKRKIRVHGEAWSSVSLSALWHEQGNWGKIRQWTLVWAGNKTGRNKSWRL